MSIPSFRFVSVVTIAYVIISMSMVSLWHFVFFADHYASVGIARSEPLMALGFLTMLLQGVAVAFLFFSYVTRDGGSSIAVGIRFGLLLALFLGTYLAFAEAGKYTIPSIKDWILIEGMLALVQYPLVGIVASLVHRNTVSS